MADKRLHHASTFLVNNSLSRLALALEAILSLIMALNNEDASLSNGTTVFKPASLPKYTLTDQTTAPREPGRDEAATKIHGTAGEKSLATRSAGQRNWCQSTFESSRT